MIKYSESKNNDKSLHLKTVLMKSRFTKSILEIQAKEKFIFQVF